MRIGGGLAEHVNCGVYEVGGFPVEFPVMSLGEPSLRPTAMEFRNLASSDVEEPVRDNPVVGMVLQVGCDKMTLALLIGAVPTPGPKESILGGCGPPI